MAAPFFRRFLPGYRWEGVALQPYKEEGTAFRSVTRQVLFDGGGDLPVQLRYFEVGPDGYTSLERHRHTHVVWISRGRGKVYVGGVIRTVFPGDLISVPASTWHQFRALPTEPLGFHCLVAAERDLPEHPSEIEWTTLTANPATAEFLRR